MLEKECIPYAPMLIESMRSIGYSFPSAIADLLDNSISAEASNIEIYINSGTQPSIVILDDGIGMSEIQLDEAMRYGSQSPLEQRSENDLGRFGLGMKSASLSQCRKLKVVSKQNEGVYCLSWDLDYVIEKKGWYLKCYSTEEVNTFPYINNLYQKETGTYILLEDFDRILEGTTDINTTLNRHVDEMIEHVSLVFHRYLSDSLTICVNNRIVKPKDPFLESHNGTQKKRIQSFLIHGKKIELRPFILPHYSKLSSDDIEKVGGKSNFKNQQGFYVYRNRRLIIWGTWFRLENKDELSKLARIMVDIPNSLDFMWSIDIKKSSATLPDILKKSMYNAVYESVMLSENVHTYRGRSINKGNDEHIWERIDNRGSIEYKINRKLPHLLLLKEVLSQDHFKLIDNLFELLEESFPKHALYVDVSKGRTDENDYSDLEDVWRELIVQLDHIKKSNLDLKKYCEAFMITEPYCRYEIIKERLKKEMDLYE